MTEVWSQEDASLRSSAEKVLHRAISAINIYNEDEYAVEDKDLSLLDTNIGEGNIKAVLKGKIVRVHEEIVSLREQKVHFLAWISLLSGLHHENFSKIAGIKHSVDNNVATVFFECFDHRWADHSHDAQLSWHQRIVIIKSLVAAVSLVHQNSAYFRKLSGDDVWMSSQGQVKVQAYLGMELRHDLSPDALQQAIITHQSKDIFALGLMMLNSLSWGAISCDADMTRTVTPEYLQMQHQLVPLDCPEPLEALALWCLETDPTKRPTAAQCLHEISNILKVLPEMNVGEAASTRRSSLSRGSGPGCHHEASIDHRSLTPPLQRRLSLINHDHHHHGLALTVPVVPTRRLSRCGSGGGSRPRTPSMMLFPHVTGAADDDQRSLSPLTPAIPTMTLDAPLPLLSLHGQLVAMEYDLSGHIHELQQNPFAIVDWQYFRDEDSYRRVLGDIFQSLQHVQSQVEVLAKASRVDYSHPLPLHTVAVNHNHSNALNKQENEENNRDKKAISSEFKDSYDDLKLSKSEDLRPEYDTSSDEEVESIAIEEDKNGNITMWGHHRRTFSSILVPESMLNSSSNGYDGVNSKAIAAVDSRKQKDNNIISPAGKSGAHSLSYGPLNTAQKLLENIRRLDAAYVDLSTVNTAATTTASEATEPRYQSKQPQQQQQQQQAVSPIEKDEGDEDDEYEDVHSRDHSLHSHPRVAKEFTSIQRSAAPLPAQTAYNDLYDAHSTGASLNYRSNHRHDEDSNNSETLNNALQSYLSLVNKCSNTSARAKQLIDNLDRRMDDIQHQRSSPSTLSSSNYRSSIDGVRQQQPRSVRKDPLLRQSFGASPDSNASVMSNMSSSIGAGSGIFARSTKQGYSNKNTAAVAGSKIGEDFNAMAAAEESKRQLQRSVSPTTRLVSPSRKSNNDSVVSTSSSTRPSVRSPVKREVLSTVPSVRAYSISPSKSRSPWLIEKR